jgi:hypothetical protein
MKNKVFAPVFVILLAGAFSSGSAHAQTAVGGYKLKNPSSFQASDTAHNPFWPIGWAKAAPVATVATTAAAAVPVAALKAEDFVVTSILINEPPLAVINGKEMAEGEMTQMQVGSQRIVVQLAAVQDGRVVLRCQNHNLVVPLRRKGEILPVPAPAATASLVP